LERSGSPSRARVQKLVSERFPNWYATTNWDMALETGFESERGITVNKVDHIHGSTGRPQRMLLPSEVVEEPYNGVEQREALTHSILPYKPLSWARQVCIYGLGLSISDAELAATLRMGFQRHEQPPGTVILINRGDQLGVLSRRIRGLCGDGWTIECIDVDAA
ncbi:MAG: hypothetical protein ACXWLM_11660, partial [Myxococcales bacterium]